MLRGVKIHLGPELRAMYPVVVNLGISGDVEVSGPANPNLIRIGGTINLDGGEVPLPLPFPLRLCCALPCTAHLLYCCFSINTPTGYTQAYRLSHARARGGTHALCACAFVVGALRV